ncbi:MAG: hydroxyisourate hydrolase [Rhizobiaceae bacterium]
MALVTSHTLNGTDGTHAAGIFVSLTNLATGTMLFSATTDEGGRLSSTIAPSLIDPEVTHELLFDVKLYWAARRLPATVNEIALRLVMADPDGSYHLPIIINPNSYSMWSSA